MNITKKIPIAFLILLTQSYAQTPENTTTESTGDTIFALLAISILFSILLAIPGTIMGLKGRLVIYYGNTDLAVTCGVLTLGIASISIASASDSKGLAFMAFVITGLLFIISLLTSYSANKSFPKAVLSVATKLVLFGLIVLCAILVTGGLSEARKGAFQGQKKRAAKGAMMAAAGAGGYYGLRKLISRFVKEPPETKS